jgi:hypothetical protein
MWLRIEVTPMTPMKLRTLAAIACAILTTNTAGAKDPYFNAYVIDAYKMLKANYAEKGYGDAWFTHDIDYGGKKKAIKASKHKPKTMCNAAVTETLLEAINLYAKGHKKERWSAAKIIPRESWTVSSWSNLLPHLGAQDYIDYPSFKKYRDDLPNSLIGQIGKFHSLQGMPKALAKFGLGEEIDFKEARAGDVITFDRDVVNMQGREAFSGHSVIFLAFLTRDQRAVDEYKDGDIVGFKYFSSQGENPGGLGERWAYFKGEMCPFSPNYSPKTKICKDQEVTEANRSRFPALLTGPRDCCVKRSGPNGVRVGRILMPNLWSYSTKQAEIANEDREIQQRFKEYIALRKKENERLKLAANGAVVLEKTDPQIVTAYFQRVQNDFGVDLRSIARVPNTPDLGLRTVRGILQATPATVTAHANLQVKSADKKNLDRRVQQTSADELGLLRATTAVGVPNQNLDGMSSD